MLTKNEEKVLKHLISKLETSKLSVPNRVIIGIGQYEFCNLSSKETISIIKRLHETNYINATFKPHEDGSSPCIIDLKEAGLNYEFHKKESRNQLIIKAMTSIISSFFKGLGSGLVKLFAPFIKIFH